MKDTLEEQIKKLEIEIENYRSLLKLRVKKCIDLITLQKLLSDSPFAGRKHEEGKNEYIHSCIRYLGNS